MEAAAKIQCDEKKVEEAGELYKQCSLLYRENGNGDKGAEVLVQAAAAIKQVLNRSLKKTLVFNFNLELRSLLRVRWSSTPKQ